MKWIDGGVCAAEGFRAAGIHAGVKTHADWKKDIALIISDRDCTAAGAFTKNVVKAAPVKIDIAHIASGKARGIIANSGNANACAPRGEEYAIQMCKAAADVVGCEPENILVSSTGVIGQALNIQAIEDHMAELYQNLSRSADASDAAAHAIMTTDTVKKEAAIETMIDGKKIHIGGIAKGSGMIHPNMGTMLCFITTDCAIDSKYLKKALLDAIAISFNRISVDGDTSTNDSCMILANGMAENRQINNLNEDYDIFLDALRELCVLLAKKMASDGEGAKHLITCEITGGKDINSAEIISKSVISSTLTKAAIFGADANWGRVLCAMGYSGEKFDPDKINIAFASAAGEIEVCHNGRGLDFDEDLAKKILTEHDIEIKIAMQEGDASCICWGCDITYDYIKINGDYRT